MADLYGVMRGPTTALATAIVEGFTYTCPANGTVNVPFAHAQELAGRGWVISHTISIDAGDKGASALAKILAPIGLAKSSEVSGLRSQIGIPGEWSAAEAFPASAKRNGAIYDASNLSTLFKDVAGKIPVTTYGDKVALMMDLSGNGNHARQSVEALRPEWRTDGCTAWLRSDGTQYLAADVSEHNARESVLVTGVLYDDLTWQTNSSAMNIGRSALNTPFIVVGDRSANWSAQVRGDDNVAVTVNSDANAADLRSGKVLGVISTSGALTLRVDNMVYSAASGVTPVTADKVTILGNSRNTTGEIIKGRFFGGVWISGATNDRELGRIYNWLQSRMRHWSNVARFTPGAMGTVTTAPGQRLSAWYIDALGSTPLNTAIGDRIDGTDLGGLFGTLRFGAAIDPDDPSKLAQIFILNRNDPDTGGVNKKRIEWSFEVGGDSAKLAYGQRHVFAYKFRPRESWAGTDDMPLGTSSRDAHDKALVWQIHAGKDVPQSPYFYGTIVNDMLYIGRGHQTNGYNNPTFFEYPPISLPQQKWSRMWGEIVPDFQGTNGGMLKVFLDGELVVDYKGPIGYDTSSMINGTTVVTAPLGHFKVGIYKPLDGAGALFSDKAPTRSLYVKGFMMRRDPYARAKDLIDQLDAL